MKFTLKRLYKMRSKILNSDIYSRFNLKAEMCTTDDWTILSLGLKEELFP